MWKSALCIVTAAGLWLGVAASSPAQIYGNSTYDIPGSAASPNGYTLPGPSYGGGPQYPVYGNFYRGYLRGEMTGNSGYPAGATYPRYDSWYRGYLPGEMSNRPGWGYAPRGYRWY